MMKKTALCSTWLMITSCTSPANRPGDAAWAHLEDDDGRGSNAQCVTVSAAPGVPVPQAGSGP